jgi:hypothetical protein
VVVSAIGPGFRNVLRAANRQCQLWQKVVHTPERGCGSRIRTRNCSAGMVAPLGKRESRKSTARTNQAIGGASGLGDYLVSPETPLSRGEALCPYPNPKS